MKGIAVAYFSNKFAFLSLFSLIASPRFVFIIYEPPKSASDNYLPIS